MCMHFPLHLVNVLSCSIAEHKLDLICVEAVHLEHDFDNEVEGMGGRRSVRRLGIR